MYHKQIHALRNREKSWICKYLSKTYIFFFFSNLSNARPIAYVSIFEACLSFHFFRECDCCVSNARTLFLHSLCCAGVVFGIAQMNPNGVSLVDPNHPALQICSQKLQLSASQVTLKTPTSSECETTCVKQS